MELVATQVTRLVTHGAMLHCYKIIKLMTRKKRNDRSTTCMTVDFYLITTQWELFSVTLSTRKRSQRQGWGQEWKKNENHHLLHYPLLVSIDAHVTEIVKGDLSFFDFPCFSKWQKGFQQRYKYLAFCFAETSFSIEENVNNSTTVKAVTLSLCRCHNDCCMHFTFSPKIPMGLSSFIFLRQPYPMFQTYGKVFCLHLQSYGL